MLAHRIIPVVLCRGRALVKGKQFNSWRSVGVAAQACRIHAARGVDEMIILDIGATPEGRGPDLDLVRELSECCFMPLTVGGGVRTVADAKSLLKAGADKVAVGAGGTAVINEISGSLGCQAVVAIINYRCPANIEFYAQQLESAGAGEILLQSIDREGMMCGYDLDTITRVAAATSVPIIASGGCGSYEHMVQAIVAGADATAAGAFFQFEDATPRGAAEYLQEHGVEARIPI